MLPLLAFAGDGKDHRLNDVMPILSLSETDKAETIPSGQSRLAIAHMAAVVRCAICATSGNHAAAAA